MNDLEKLAKKYGTDKYGKHNYCPVYYELFKDRRKSVKKVVEIGTGEGAGLRMFRDFFPNAHIYGADIDPKRVVEIYSRTTILECDQSKNEDLEDLIMQIGSDIDLFLDDGSHRTSDQIFSCMVVFPLLSEKSLYIIEDVCEPEVLKKLLDAAFDSMYKPNIVEVEVIDCGKRYDDRLVIIRHKI